MNNTVLLICLVLLCSCGARKTEKNRLEESLKTEVLDKSETEKVQETKSNSETNINRTTEKTVSNQDQTTTVKEIIEPLDATKKATYKDKNGNIQELNNAKKTIETTTKNNNSKTEVREKLEQSKKVDSASNKKERAKKNVKTISEAKKSKENIKIDRKESIFWGLFWFIILIVLLFVVWRLYSKYISKI